MQFALQNYIIFIEMQKIHSFFLFYENFTENNHYLCTHYYIIETQMKHSAKTAGLVLFALLAMITSNASAAEKQLTKYVNQFIGAGGHGHVFVGANVPFGLVQLGPSENTRGWDWCSGYHVSDSVLIGFGMMHLSGTGIGDLGDIALLPVETKEQTEVIFSHKNEIVHPGYYSLHVDNPNANIELTATKRVGMHRYTFNNREAMLRLDLKQGVGWDALSDCSYKQENATTITGYRRSEGWAKDQCIYFAMEFSRPVVIDADSKDKATIHFDGGTPMIVKVALSPTSAENAKKNMRAELPGWDFDTTVQRANDEWNKELARVEIETNNEKHKEIFYTAMYHLMIAPSLFCDVDKTYRGADGKNHAGDFDNYTTFSLWDTYRAAHPLMSLILPDKQRDFVRTFMQIYEEGGRLPIWHLMANETECMVGNPGIIVLADLMLKGFVDKADSEKAYEAMKNSALHDSRQLDLLKKYGYIPYDKSDEGETVAKALEYCIADAGLAKVAKMLGKTEDYKYFLKRSRSYAKYFDKKTQFMRAVSSKGEFRTPFDPIKAAHRANDYTEGNAWQYTWLVPHDVYGLINLFGSEKAFLKKFDQLFLTEGDLGENASPDISGLIGQYAHGNEPSHHVVYMYNYAGQPWKTARLLRQIYDEMYTNEEDGLCGNEDVGQMSAWYISSTIGLYQVDPSGGRYVIGSPLFDKATVNVGGGKTFTVEATNNSAENIYIQSATLNGQPYTKTYIEYADLTAGGTLRLVMGPTPSKWGTAKKDRP